MPAYCITCKELKKQKPTRASFNVIGKPPRYCSQHKETEMINTASNKCIHADRDTNEKCIKRASYNYPNYKHPKYCLRHKLDGMTNVASKKCRHKGCSRRAIFNYEGRSPEYCFRHKENNMIDVYSKKCKESGCIKQPSFNYPNKISYIYCGEHKKEGMIDLRMVKYLCKICDEIQANYNYPDLKAEFCAGCKNDDMINVRSPKCVECNIHIPVYNYQGLKHIYCAHCKKNGMVDTRSKKCDDLNCDKQARYNYKGIKRSLFCLTHAKDGMINIKEPRCTSKNTNGDTCDEIAYYNYIGEKNPIFCGIHMLLNMINVRGNYKLCVHPDCQKIANRSVAEFGLLFHDKTHCVIHKQPNEFRNNNPRCEGDDSNIYCQERPFYCHKYSDFPIRCEYHKLIDDINMIENPCQNCKLPYLLNSLNNLCTNCDAYQNKRIIKSKEFAVQQLLYDNNIKYIIHDKRLQRGCSAYRPDFVIDINYALLIIEVDENQHKSYPRHCEVTRMIQIHQDAGMPVIFIRYNPDNYRDPENKLIRHCKGRQKLLLDLIQGIRNRQEIKESLSVFYLFYDGFDGNINNIELDYFNSNIDTLVSKIYNVNTIQSKYTEPKIILKYIKPKITLK